jgi:hypothetical protein
MSDNPPTSRKSTTGLKMDAGRGLSWPATPLSFDETAAALIVRKEANDTTGRQQLPAAPLKPANA